MGLRCTERFTKRAFNAIEPEDVDLSRNCQILTKITEHLIMQTGTVLVLVPYWDPSKSLEDY